jgi:hypothetical protein
VDEDRLPSWNDGPVKEQIIEFVRQVTDERNDDFVPPPERIATWDNDGTLWSEYPLPFQVFFAADRARALAANDLELAKEPAIAALLAGDRETLAALGEEGLMQIVVASHGNITPQELHVAALGWLGTAVHPETGRRFIDMIFQPQLELLRYLEAEGFRHYIVTGGGIDFVRTLAPMVYGIPRPQVIGSSEKVCFSVENGKGTIVKLGELRSFNDKEVKAENIAIHIGVRPLIAVGNSDGDHAMLQLAAGGEGKSLRMLVHHTDGAREWAYDREFTPSRFNLALDAAAAEDILLVDMARDWRTIWPAG